jgi:hypothetical protein
MFGSRGAVRKIGGLGDPRADPAAIPPESATVDQ